MEVDAVIEAALRQVDEVGGGAWYAILGRVREITGRRQPKLYNPWYGLAKTV